MVGHGKCGVLPDAAGGNNNIREENNADIIIMMPGRCQYLMTV